MENTLNITNGDSAVMVMKDGGISGSFLPWRDVLHDGPVPAGLPLEKLSEVRAQFMVDQGWGAPETVLNGFAQRDQTILLYGKYSKITLWFEHDLYDQLQILQILNWFYEKPLAPAVLGIICTDQYLGMINPDQIKALYAFEVPITDNHMRLAKEAWAAFTSSSPERWQQLLYKDTDTLPFLNGAVLRLLEEYPDCRHGLSRTAFTALDIISKGEKKPGKIFGQYQDTEERRFMGDASFWIILNRLLASDPPLVALSPGKQIVLPISADQELSITPAGIELLSGNRNWLDTNVIDRWIGGTQLTPENLWCWNVDSQVLANMA